MCAGGYCYTRGQHVGGGGARGSAGCFRPLFVLVGSLFRSFACWFVGSVFLTSHHLFVSFVFLLSVHPSRQAGAVENPFAGPAGAGLGRAAGRA